MGRHGAHRARRRGALRRAARLLLVAVPLGLATSFAVAWGCAVRVSYADHGRIEHVRTQAPPVWSMRGTGSEIVCSETRALLARILLGLEIHEVPADPTDWSDLRQHGFHDSGVLAEEARGWPMPCLRWRLVGASVETGIELGAPRLFPDGDEPWNLLVEDVNQIVLPYGPIWLGLAADTLVYGALWLLVLFLPRVARIVGRPIRRIRQLRGRCPQCGYPAATGAGRCSECGHPARIAR